MPNPNHPTPKILRVGDPGVNLPQEVLDSLGLKEGDRVMVLQTQGGEKIVPYDSTFEEVMEFARDYMHRHADAMRKLAE